MRDPRSAPLAEHRPRHRRCALLPLPCRLHLAPPSHLLGTLSDIWDCRRPRRPPHLSSRPFIGELFLLSFSVIFLQRRRRRLQAWFYTHKNHLDACTRELLMELTDVTKVHTTTTMHTQQCCNVFMRCRLFFYDPGIIRE